MDLASIVVLALKSKVHWEACVDKSALDAILLDNRLVSLKMAPGDKHPLAVLVDVGDKVVGQYQTINLRQHALWLLGWLIRPPNCILDVIKAVVPHTCPAHDITTVAVAFASIITIAAAAANVTALLLLPLRPPPPP